MHTHVTNPIDRRPPRKWSIVALSIAGAAAVLISYIFFLTLAIACLALPVVFLKALVTFSSSSLLVVEILLSLFGLVAGLTILWSLIPRRDKFEPTGILIDPAREKRLMTEIEIVAASLQEAMPRDVYLIPDPNAFVAQRGGYLGIGSRRILGLGLPLLATLSVSELRALLAHEFAHFYSGDTRLGPWLYGARLSMVRVARNLGEDSPIRHLTRFGVVAIAYTLLMGGLRLYWETFMRVSQLISRQQEYRSDEIACYVAGSQPFADVLRKLPKAEAVLQSFCQSVVQLLVTHGYQPRIVEDLVAYQATPRNEGIALASLQERLHITRPKPFDSHPPVSARIARVESLGIAATDANNQPAWSLFENLESCESDLLRKLVPELEKVDLKPMSWETAGTDIYLPAWRKHIERFLPMFAGKTVASLPEYATYLGPIADKVHNPPGRILNRPQREDQAASILAYALTASLVDGGWTLHMGPGSCYLKRDSMILYPHDVLAALRSQSMSAGDWQAFCVNTGIGDWPLGRATLPPV